MVGSFSLVEVVFETWSNLLLNPEEGFHLDIILEVLAFLHVEPAQGSWRSLLEALHILECIFCYFAFIKCILIYYLLKDLSYLKYK